MSYLLTIVALVAAGLALLDLLRLRTGRPVPDVALAWLVGSGWLAAVAPALRFAAGVPFGRAAVLAVVLAPLVVWGGLRVRRRAPLPGPLPAARGEGEGEGGVPAPLPAARGDGEPIAAEGGRASSERSAPLPGPLPAARGEGEGSVSAPLSAARGEGENGVSARWLPRPVWLFAPLALYVAVVLAMVVLHGTNTPTHTDDAVRVRAFAPMLAWFDRWDPEALKVFAMAAPLTTFIPSVAWILTGAIDHFHVNYAVLTELVALLALAVGLGAARGEPERGWAGAFAVLSLPLFVYHCTSTYADAVLAMRVAGGVLLAAEYARTRDRDDLCRAALLLGVAALVKREGELVAAAPAGVLAAQVAWERWRERRPIPWRAAALVAAPVVVAAVGKIAALGVAGAFPMVGVVFTQAGEAAGAAGAAGAAEPRGQLVAEASRLFFEGALFRSGNQGMLYWILAAVLAVRARHLGRREVLWPLLALAALFLEVALSSVVLLPRFTIDQSTVNRALLVLSVPAALWVAGAIVDAARADALAGGGEAQAVRAGGGAEAATPRERRRRSRRASRR